MDYNDSIGDAYPVQCWIRMEGVSVVVLVDDVAPGITCRPTTVKCEMRRVH